jgi:glucosamine kinase
MILIADSGSTKCDWMLIDQKTKVPTSTIGFNPFFHTSDFIYEEISKNEVLSRHAQQISHIYYYGASCSSKERCAIVRQGLEKLFTQTKEISIDHDLKGAAIASCGSSEGIACILGTGSNSCYFDGIKVYEEIPALGFILGDEGSGSYFGKLLLSMYLYKQLPDDIHAQFVDKYQISKEDILASIYNKPNVNVYLASFMPFYREHIGHPFMADILYKGLQKFAQTHIQCYSNYESVSVNFIGSIAHYFEPILNVVAKDMGFKIGRIVKKPIDGLYTFHSRN